jgi:quinohemoprotein ethanol dehydrogenase
MNDNKLDVDEAAVIRGTKLYAEKVCGMCHGIDTKSVGGQALDLRRSAIALSPEALGTFLRSGVSAIYGMPKFPELTDEEVKSLYMYIRAGAREALGKRKPGITSGSSGL